MYIVITFMCLSYRSNKGSLRLGSCEMCSYINFVYLLNFSRVTYDAVICFFVCGVSNEGIDPAEVLVAPPSAPRSSCDMSSSS